MCGMPSTGNYALLTPCRMRSRIEKNLREMEELKRTRDARLAAREDMEMMQRDADRKAHAQWTSKEAEFQLQQAKVNLFGQS